VLGCYNIAGIADLEVRPPFDAADASDADAAVDSKITEDAHPCSAKSSTISCPADMVAVPGGCYATYFGGRDVAIDAYCIDRTEVTAASYRTCVDVGGCPDEPAAVTLGPMDDPTKYDLYVAACNIGQPTRENHPMNCVKWTSARAFCASKGKRLPTTDEWEWVARGESRGALYPWGTAEPADQLCWSGGGFGLSNTCPVGAFPSGDDPLGIHDLAGNVAEHTSTESMGTASDHVVRGGSWSEVYPLRVGLTVGFSHPSDWKNNNIGFRCALTP
jgi:formylglycine-generating enzyme required for sulfatase activity